MPMWSIVASPFAAPRRSLQYAAGEGRRRFIPSMGYNEVRLHSAIGYVTPATVLAGDKQRVLDARDAKLAAAREQRAARRHVASAA